MEGGADVVDIKEPSNGPLGAAPASLRAEIASACAGSERKPVVSAAAGELLELGDPGSWDVGAGISFHKIGLSGCRGKPWEELLGSWADSLREGPAPSALVPVAYADAGRSGSPPPGDVLEFAGALGLDLILVDTHDKSRGSLRDSLPDADLIRLIDEGSRRGVAVALAGSLSRDDIRALAPLRPRLLGVRGAACEGARRDGEVVAERVRELADACRSPALSR
jgi:uncharacterized protein (UPF0264 family)